MNPVRGVLSTEGLAGRWLYIGRSPIAWHQVTGEVRSRLQELRRWTKWMSFPEEARPRLREGPLLGNGLEIATGGFARTAEREAAAPGHRRSVRPTARPAPRPSVERHGPLQDLTSWRAATERGQVLRHAAGRSRAKLPADVARLGSVLQAEDSGTRTPHIGAQVTPAPQAHTAFANLLFRRVSQALQYLPQYPREAKRDIRSLVEQWSTSLEGQMADVDLLNGSAGHTSKTTTNGVDRGEGSPVSQQFFEGDVQRSDGNGRHEPMPPSPESLSPPRLDWNEGDADAFRRRDLAASYGPPMWARFTTPSQPEPDGRSAAVLRSNTTPVAPLDWNLSALSDAIERILDAEARRHGIGV